MRFSSSIVGTVVQIKCHDEPRLLQFTQAQICLNFVGMSFDRKFFLPAPWCPSSACLANSATPAASQLAASPPRLLRPRLTPRFAVAVAICSRPVPLTDLGWSWSYPGLKTPLRTVSSLAVGRGQRGARARDFSWLSWGILEKKEFRSGIETALLLYP